MPNSTKPQNEFLVMSQESKWAICSTASENLPLAVQHSAFAIIRLTKDSMQVLKDKSQKEDILKHLPNRANVSYAKRLRGNVSLGLPQLMLAALDKDQHKKKLKLTFAFADVDIGFYVGFPPDRFENVDWVDTQDNNAVVPTHSA